tara:strand:- start:19 stop:324 length:306 start_codon:yes stop_codon:yes gene_type:complete
VKQAWAVDKNNNLWLKGKCAGWELIRSESKKEQTELDEPQLIGISEWTDLSSDEEVTRKAQSAKFRRFHAKRMAEIEEYWRKSKNSMRRRWGENRILTGDL